MSPFITFAVCLTIAYIIYYGVVIYKDLYGKKGVENKEVEEFDVSSIKEEEKPVVVHESGDSFAVGNENTEQENPTEESEVASEPEQPVEEEESAPTPLDEKLARVNDQLYATEVYSTGGVKENILTEMLYGDVSNAKPGIMMERTKF